MSGRIQNLLIVLGVLVLAYLGYYLYSNNSSGVLGTNDVSVTSQAAEESAAFLRRLNELKQIELNASIFSDARFQSLQTFSPALEVYPFGRENPFAPVE